MSGTSFEDALNDWSLDPDSEFEDIASLYKCVENESDCGVFSCSRKNKSLYIEKEGAEYTLALVSTEAKNAFLEKVLDKYCDGNRSIDLWAQSKRDNAKD